MVLPQGIAGAMTPFPERAGAASSLFGFVQQSAAAVCGAVVGWFLGQSAWPLALGVAVMGCATLALWLADARHPRARAASTDSAAAEQIIEQPAVEAAAARGCRTIGCDRLYRERAASVAIVRRTIRRTGRRRRARQARDRHALMRAAHEAAPDFHRQAAAGDVLGRRAVVIAEPDAGDEVRGVADEPGVAEILRRAGLAGRRPARQRRLVRGADGQRLAPSSRSSSPRSAPR